MRNMTGTLKQMKAPEFAVYAFLDAYSTNGQIETTNRQIEDWLFSVSHVTVGKAINSLLDRGWLELLNPDAQGVSKRLYRVLPYDEWKRNQKAKQEAA